MKYNIFYGVLENMMNITDICMKECFYNDNIIIPDKDVARSKIFGDPVSGKLKYIFIFCYNILISTIPEDKYVLIDCKSGDIRTNNLSENLGCVFIKEDYFFKEKLDELHKNLIIKHGNFLNEYPEQIMISQFITGNEKVLELGSNIGRSSLIIGKILNDNNNNNFVTFETDSNNFLKLKENRDINGLDFYIENAALSEKKLIQKGWTTIISDVVLDGWTSVNTMTYDELCKKYNIIFDTLVADCEGALLPIIIDIPHLLKNINLIIMENDYGTLKEKICLDYILEYNGFKLIYSRPLHVSNRDLAYTHSFYEVWKKI